MVLFQKQEYETETVPDQRRSEEETLFRDRDLHNAFSRWKTIARGLVAAVVVLSVMLVVTFAAGCFFAYRWYAAVPMPIVFHHDSEGYVRFAQVGWPQPNPTAEKTKAGLVNMFKRMRRVSFDQTVTAESLNMVPPFLTVRAQNLLAAFNQQHPLDKFYERKVIRRVYGFEPRQDPNTPSVFYLRWKEELIDEWGSRVKEPVEIAATVWTVPNATCPQTLEQLAANPDCVVVDSFEWNAMN